MTDSGGPDQTAPRGRLQQTIFSDAFFLGVLRVKHLIMYRIDHDNLVKVIFAWCLSYCVTLDLKTRQANKS